MTATEFRVSLAALGWSRRMLANRLGCDMLTVQQWAEGTLPIPQAVVVWLTRMRLDQAASLVVLVGDGPADPPLTSRETPSRGA